MSRAAFDLTNEFADTETEQRLIAAVAAERDVYWRVCDMATLETFTSDENRAAWDSVRQAVEDGLEMPFMDKDWIPADDPEHTARLLADLQKRRMAAAAVGKISASLFTGDMSGEDAGKALEDAAADVQMAIRASRTNRTQALPDLFHDVLDKLNERHLCRKQLGGANVGLPTGLRQVDNLLGGLQPGLHVLAAEPGAGKTMLSLQICSHLARQGWPALFVSFEETLDRLALKTVCQCARLNWKEYWEGKADPEDVKGAMRRYDGELSRMHIVEGTARLTVAEVKARALSILHRHKTDKLLIVVDYLQRWASGSDDNRWDFRHVVSRLVGELRDQLALRLDSPLLLISSMNRASYGSSAMSALKESGDIEYSADTVLMLTEPNRDNRFNGVRHLTLTVAKNRHGDQGSVPLVFNPLVCDIREETAGEGR